MNFLSTLAVVPSAKISKNEAHSPQLKPSAREESECCGWVASDVARRPIRASATFCTVMKGVVNQDSVSAQTVALNGLGSAK